MHIENGVEVYEYKFKNNSSKLKLLTRKLKQLKLRWRLALETLF